MAQQTRYFYDTEFLEDGTTIELISIGIVSSSGREYYAVNADMPVARITADQWLMKHVWPSLPLHDGTLDRSNEKVKAATVIRDEVERFLLAEADPELWAYYSAYDHVALCQLWGRMIDLPEGIPRYTHDIKQHMDLYPKFVEPNQAVGEHNALHDARHNQLIFDALQSHIEAIG